MHEILTNIGQPIALRPLLDLVSRLALRDAPSTTELGIQHFRQILRYATPINSDAEHFIRRGVGSWPDEPVGSAQDILDLEQIDVSADALTLSDHLSASIKSLYRRFESGFLVLRPEVIPRSAQEQWYRGLLQRVSTEVPGQTQAAKVLARQLAMQLGNNDRVTPVRTLLCGPDGSGARNMARAVANELKDSGYAVLELEMAQIRCDEEAVELDGGLPQWKGSRPGKLTSFVYSNPKAVVILHDIDRTFPKVQATLLPAFRDGVMLDNQGLEAPTVTEKEFSKGARSTPVNMSQAVFLLTSSTGHEVWAQPDLAELLEKDDSDLRDAQATVLSSMQTATSILRGQEVSVFDAATLAHLEPALVLLRPIRWQHVLDRATSVLNQALVMASHQVQHPIELREGQADVFAKAYVASFGGKAGLDHLTVPRMAQELFTPLADELLNASLVGASPAAGSPIALAMSEMDTIRLQQLLAPLGADPVRQLQRRRLSLRCDWNFDKTDPHAWCLWLTAPRLVQVKDVADFSGEVALSATVPNVRFADIAGQAEAKRHLQEVISLYQQADALHAQGITLPRGCVLYGPPGTGKTLLAQAFAAEADMAFIASNGSDLLNQDRVKALFALARRNAPCVLFIDEADTLGRRGHNSGVHDAAINRLLAMIQGFDQRAPVYVLAATNRPQLLDDALIRPGRLDHSIYIGPLDRSGREPLVRQLLNLLEPGSYGEPSAMESLLTCTHQMTGADLSQAVRECSLLRLRLQRDGGQTLTLNDLMEQVSTQKYGGRGKSLRHSDVHERIAFHEAGHAVLHALWFPELSIEQVTVTPRSQTEGFLAINQEQSIQLNETPRRVLQHIGVLLGGRMAEVLRYGPIDGPSSGSASDFGRARAAAFKAVAYHGLDQDFGCISLVDLDDEDRALIPEELKSRLWARVRVWLTDAERLAQQTLKLHWSAIEALARELVVSDYVTGSRVHELLSASRETNLPTTQPTRIQRVA